MHNGGIYYYSYAADTAEENVKDLFYFFLFSYLIPNVYYNIVLFTQ